MGILRKKPHKIQTKLYYADFEDWYLDNPWASAQDIADFFNVSLRTAYNKLKIFNKRNEKKVDIRLSSITLDAYKEGYDQGIVAGVAIGGLTADLLKTHGIGISDLVAWIAKEVRNKPHSGNNKNTQSPNTGTQTP